MVRNEKWSRLFVTLALWQIVATILHHFIGGSYGQITSKFFCFFFLFIWKIFSHLLKVWVKSRFFFELDTCLDTAACSRLLNVLLSNVCTFSHLSGFTESHLSSLLSAQASILVPLDEVVRLIDFSRMCNAYSLYCQLTYTAVSA